MSVPSAFKARLAVALDEGGSETTVYLDSLETLTGESITFSNFSPFTRGIVTVDPESVNSAQPEFVSFTGINTTAISLTGATRGLSALSDSAVDANKVFHPVGTPVIIAWGNHNITDLLTYVSGLVSGMTAGNASDTIFGITSISEDLSSRPRAQAVLASQQSSPNNTVKVNPFSIANGDHTVSYAGGNSGTFSSPSANPRIDLLVYSTVDSALAIRQGTEASSPTEPTPYMGDIVICSVYHPTGQSPVIVYERSNGTNSYIKRWYIPGVYAGGYYGLGNASDGDVTISSPTSLTRDMFYNNLTVNDVLTTNGWIIYVKGVLSGNGTIKYPDANSGNNGSTGNTGSGSNPTIGGAGGQGGAAVTGARLLNYAGANGGAGGGVSGNTTGFTGNNGSSPTSSLGANGANGGAGGNGHSSGGGTPAAGDGGNKGTATKVVSPGVLFRETILAQDLPLSGTPVHYSGSAGSGGGGGGGAASAAGGVNGGGAGGGGAGASGGVVFIICNHWGGTFTIMAKGGNGGNGGAGVLSDTNTASGGGGGGAGGSGGASVVIYNTTSWSGSYTLTGGVGGTGGTAGTGATNGANGANGANGNSYAIRFANMVG